MTFLERGPTINPSSYFKLFWDIFLINFVLLLVFYIPIKATFDMTFTELVGNNFTIVIPFILLLDIFINLNTGFFNKGRLITNRKIIFFNYLRKYCILDLVNLIYFFYFKLKN